MRRRCSSCPQSRSSLREPPVAACRAHSRPSCTHRSSSSRRRRARARTTRSSAWWSYGARRARLPSATVTTSRPAVRIRPAFLRNRRSPRSIATASSSSTRARPPGGRVSAACTSTSGCRTPRLRSGSWRRSSPGCPSCSLCLRTPRTSKAGTPACSRFVRRCWGCCRAMVRRLPSATTPSGSGSSSGWPSPAWRATTRASGGTSVCIHASGPSRFGPPIRRRRSRVPRRWCATSGRSANGRSMLRRVSSTRANEVCTTRTAGPHHASVPHGKLIHPNRNVALTVAELADELPIPLDGLDPRSCEADRQLEVGRANGLHAVCADLVERSVP